MVLDKQTLRKVMKEKRRNMSYESWLTDSHIIHQKVLTHPIYQKSKRIGIYVHLPFEVETQSLIEMMLKDHKVCVPKVEGNDMNFYQIQSLNDLKEGHFHVLEPKSSQLILPQDIDLMIIPMLAFDQTNHRLGYGKGYYDRYLSNGFQGYKLGLAFAWQQVDDINHDEYDQSLDEIITS